MDEKKKKLHSKTNRYGKVFSANYIPLAQNVSQGLVLANGGKTFLIPRNELLLFIAKPILASQRGLCFV